MSPRREVPLFARETFKEWFFRRPSRQTTGPRVLLWPDTFNNHFHPEVAKAAVEVLESAGWRVEVPRATLCCGRPLYDYGMLTTAKRYLRRVLRTLREDIDAGVPVVGLEPSCLAVFRDELVNLFPDDERAGKLAKQSMMLSEFLRTKAANWKIPAVRGRAIVQGHCHHKAVMGFQEESAVLDATGLQCDVLNAGCCGMAGSFGFEDSHYDVSMRVGELALLPRVRGESRDTLVVADGFSCREQIAQGAGREALHLAQVLQIGLGRPVRPEPKRALLRWSFRRVATALSMAALAVAAARLAARARRAPEG